MTSKLILLLFYLKYLLNINLFYQALDDLVMTDKSLIKYSLTNNEWTKLEQIKKLLKVKKI